MAVPKQIKRTALIGATLLACLSALPSLADNSSPTEAELKQTLEKKIAKSGENSLPVSVSLNNLAVLYDEKGRYAEAETLFKRSLAIREKTLGAEHPEVVHSLNNLATFYEAQGRYAEAETLFKRSLAINEKVFGQEHKNVAASLNDLAAVYLAQGHYAEAEPLSKRSLSIREKTVGPEHPDVALSLNSLADIYQSQGRYTEAEPLFKRSLSIREKTLGPESPGVALSLNNLADIYQAQGRYAEAEPLFKRSLAIREKASGPEDLSVAASLHNLATLYFAQGHYAEAEPLFKHSIAISQKAQGEEHPDVAAKLNILATLYLAQGRYSEAEPLFKRSLAIREKTLGLEHPDVAASLNILASLYQAQSRYSEAEPLIKRSLAIGEKSLNPDHPDMAASLTNLALFYESQGNYAAAEPLLKRSLSIYEKALGPEHPDVAQSLNNLADLYKSQGHYAEAEPLYKRSLAIREKSLGAEHPNVALSLNNLAGLYQSQAQYAKAEPLYKRSLNIYEKALGPEHPDVAQSLNNLAANYYDQGRYAEALPYSRRAYAILKNRFVQTSNVQDGELAKAGRQAEQKSKRSSFTQHIQLLSKINDASTTAESFEAAQLAKASSVGQSIAMMSARFAATEGNLAQIIRQRQDISERLTRTDKALMETLSQPSDKRNALKEEQLRQNISALEQSLRLQSREISQRFPEYDALVSPAPVTASNAQKLLKADEALLFYLVFDQQSFVWVARPNEVSFITLNIKSGALDREVRKLRHRLDPEQNPSARPFDEAASYALYQQIFAPLEEKLKGVHHIVLVNDGALQSLPFAVLVNKAPDESGTTSWLTDRYAFSVIPSVSSLRALRTFMHATPGKEFAGFGNPVLRGITKKDHGITTAAGTRQKGIANVEQIRNAPSLPETETELKEFASVLNAPANSVQVGENATETLVKKADLTKYGVLAFATHGVMAGELRGMEEPGLILTPPSQGSNLDDGYLSASEVALLKLNADWVVLSACNTAAPDGQPEAEGLSGLAKAFFYAGARSLLVSNWYVASNAATQLTTEMFEIYRNNPDTGKAEALRLAMQKLRNNPDFAQPMFWAPFSVVGEGDGRY